MSTLLKPSSQSVFAPSKSLYGKKIAILVSEWHLELTEAMYLAAIKVLEESNLGFLFFRENVPGSYELSLAAQFMAKKDEVDAVICLGCVIQGETRHFDFICNAVANGITEVSLKYNKPISFGVITANTLVQAQERAGGKYGNKGEEAAWAAIKMLNLA